MSHYAAAGVDVAAADAFTRSIADTVTATWGPHVVGSFGGFAAGITLPDGFEEPVIMMSTDGVGTKAELARARGRLAGLGYDLVAMCVDDLAAQGALPLGFTDYLAVGALDETRDGELVGSIAAACREAGCALLGGETAVHPGVMAADQFDLAGAALGVAERRRLPDPANVRAGHLIVGIASPNVRANGFSLVRSLFSDDDYDRLLPGLDRSLADVLLEPSVIYSPAVRAATNQCPVAGMAHITGGGLPGNLPRVLPDGLTAHIDTSSWTPPSIFSVIAARGVEPSDMLATFNMGIGFVLLVEPRSDGDVVALLGEHGHAARVVGEVEPGHTPRFS